MASMFFGENEDAGETQFVGLFLKQPSDKAHTSTLVFICNGFCSERPAVSAPKSLRVSEHFVSLAGVNLQPILISSVKLQLL